MRADRWWVSELLSNFNVQELQSVGRYPCGGEMGRDRR